MLMDENSPACRSQRLDAASGQPPADAQATNGNPHGFRLNLLSTGPQKRAEEKGPGQMRPAG